MAIPSKQICRIADLSVRVGTPYAFRSSAGASQTSETPPFPPKFCFWVLYQAETAGNRRFYFNIAILPDVATRQTNDQAKRPGLRNKMSPLYLRHTVLPRGSFP
jgi:hypothetical protein